MQINGGVASTMKLIVACLELCSLFWTNTLFFFNPNKIFKKLSKSLNFSIAIIINENTLFQKVCFRWTLAALRSYYTHTPPA